MSRICTWAPIREIFVPRKYCDLQYYESYNASYMYSIQWCIDDDDDDDDDEDDDDVHNDDDDDHNDNHRLWQCLC